MAESSRHDAWNGGDAYDAYMGRWSRRIAPRFLDLLEVPQALEWLEVGCGTGALSAAVLDRYSPSSLIAIDSSPAFIEQVQAKVQDARASFQVGDAQALSLASASRDAVVSALCLNFVPDRLGALAEMGRVARPGSTVAFYVWDYPGGGLEFLRRFWQAAAALDPPAAELAEDRRFSFCTSRDLTDLADTAGLRDVRCRPIEVETVFEDFEDYWQPFTLGAGPAPGYCASLTPMARERLRDRLQETLPHDTAGRIPLMARAWAVTSRTRRRN